MNAAPSAAPRRPRRLLRKLLLLATGCLVLLVGLYFVVTSAAFFKRVILPRASATLGAEVTAADASISPFSQIHLRQLKIQARGAEPWLQVEELRLRYSLLQILRGTLHVEEFLVASPVIQVIENADGSHNLGTLLAQPEPPPTATPPTDAGPPRVSLKNIALKNATIRLIRNLQDGSRETAELTGVQVTLDQLQNGQAGKLDSAATLRLTRSTNDLLEVTSSAAIAFTLGPDLLPQTVQARSEQELRRGEGAFRELAGLRVVVAGDLTPTEVKEFSKRFFRGQQTLGELKVSGPLNLAKQEGRLRLEATSIDRHVLNLIGAPLGLDFGPTTITAVSEVALERGGTAITASNRFEALRFSVTCEGLTTPPMDLQATWSVAVDVAAETARVDAFSLDGRQASQSVLQGSLTQPMVFAWGKTAAPTTDSAFRFAINQLDLAPWKPFFGDALTAGLLTSQLELRSQQNGKQLQLALESQVAGLAAPFGQPPLSEANLSFKTAARVSDFTNIALDSLNLELTRRNEPALQMSGTARFDGLAFQAQAQSQTFLARLLGSGPATPLTAGLKLEGTLTNNTLDLRQGLLSLTPTPRAAQNEISLSGQLNLSDPHVIQGALLARSDTLDLTPLFDAFFPETASTPPASPTPTPTPAPPAEEAEPEAMVLPVRLSADLNLAQLLLREIAAKDCRVSLKLDGGKLKLDPCQMTLNGAPVSASVDLDMGVPGYTYAFNAALDGVPLEPLANSFSPSSRGAYQGLLLANAQIQGAGLTGKNLQKNLRGQTSFTFTNANLQLVGPRTRQVLVPIAALLRVPDLTQTPLNWLETKSEIGQGTINLTRFMVQSPAFEAQSQGAITLSEVLTNSALNLPVEFALRRSLAEKSSLLPPNTPPDAPYAALPRFITIKGTLGSPVSDLNELALSGLLLKSGVGLAEKLGVKIDPKTGNALQGVGNLLTGQRTASTNPPTGPASTNQPATNPPAFNPLDLFKRR